jgi:RNase P/RNase MRP subunit POP5
MSVYNQSISKTHIIDPVYNRANFRAEYRLEPETIYFSNLRLIGLGVEGTTGGKRYNALCGAYGIIKQIILMDDNEVLDQLHEANRFLSFKMFNNENQKSMDVNNSIAKNASGNAFLGLEDGANSAGSKITTWEVRPSTTGVIGGARGESRAWLDLKKALPLLSSLSALDTRQFKNLKVIVEYSSDLDDFMREADDTNTATYEAQLIADEIIDVNERKAQAWPGSVAYTSIEHDVVSVPAVTPTDADNTPVQTQRFKVNGFLNKSVGRVLIQKAPLLLGTYKTGNDNHNVGKWASSSFFGEKLNLRVNGVTKLAGQGITDEASRLAVMHDAWGRCSAYPFSSSLAYEEADGTDRDVFIKTGNNDIGVLDYYGMFINDEVLDLQVDFERKGCYVYSSNPKDDAADAAATAAAVENAATDLHIFCEVYKTIQSQSDGSYLVSYV